jgi:hypothetical protein
LTLRSRFCFAHHPGAHDYGWAVSPKMTISTRRLRARPSGYRWSRWGGRVHTILRFHTAGLTVPEFSGCEPWKDPNFFEVTVVNGNRVGMADQTHLVGNVAENVRDAGDDGKGLAVNAILAGRKQDGLRKTDDQTAGFQTQIQRWRRWTQFRRRLRPGRWRCRPTCQRQSDGANQTRRPVRLV